MTRYVIRKKCTMTKKHAETADTADVRAMLAERGKVYGNFAQSCQVDIAIIDAMSTHHFNTTGRVFEVDDIIIVSKITHKLARIAGTLNHVDSWRDLAAYATLIADGIEAGELFEQG